MSLGSTRLLKTSSDVEPIPCLGPESHRFQAIRRMAIAQMWKLRNMCRPNHPSYHEEVRIDGVLVGGGKPTFPSRVRFLGAPYRFFLSLVFSFVLGKVLFFFSLCGQENLSRHGSLAAYETLRDVRLSFHWAGS